MAIKPNLNTYINKYINQQNWFCPIIVDYSYSGTIWSTSTKPSNGKVDNNPSRVHVIFRPLLQIMILVPCITSVNGECCTGSEDGSESCKCTVKYQF